MDASSLSQIEMREHFVKWAILQGYDVSIHHHGGYNDEFTRGAWIGFLGCRDWFDVR